MFIEFGIGIGLICLHFSSISLICLLYPITEFILLWIREFLVVVNIVVIWMHTDPFNAWIYTKGRNLGVINFNTRYFSGPMLININLFLLHHIIR